MVQVHPIRKVPQHGLVPTPPTCLCPMATLVQLLRMEQKSWLPLVPGSVGELARSALSSTPILSLKLPQLGKISAMLVKWKLHSLCAWCMWCIMVALLPVTKLTLPLPLA